MSGRYAVVQLLRSTLHTVSANNYMAAVCCAECIASTQLPQPSGNMRHQAARFPVRSAYVWQCRPLEALCDACAQVVCILKALQEVAVLPHTRHAKCVAHTANLHTLQHTRMLLAHWTVVAGTMHALSRRCPLNMRA
jgi:hypothetical protein